MNRRQQVYISQTESGQLGFFTNGFLVVRLTKDQVRDKEVTAQRMDFDLIQEPHNVNISNPC